ncbi:MAG: sigma 54-interacting transcriptional regulator [Deltaproteobacteria bacterium]|nr:sigma 54-interacting transcriptional regulator [Deltaproteobacteria bacterium]
MSREVDRRPRRWQHARVSHEAFLEIKTVSGKRYSFPLEAESTLVGHDAKDVALYIEDPLLSKQHFAIERRGAEWVLIDAGSRNGTFVDGVKLKERAEAKLKDGAAITCGLTTLVFRLGAINEQAPPVRRLVRATSEYFRAADLLSDTSDPTRALLVRLAEEVLPEPDPVRLMHAALRMAQERLGAEGAAIADVSGTILARHPNGATIDVPPATASAATEQRALMVDPGPPASIAAPLLEPHVVTRVLYAERATPFSKDEVAWAAALGAIIGPALERAERGERLEREREKHLLALRSLEGAFDAIPHLLGSSAASAQLRSEIAATAAHARPLLLYGEPGAGREAIARAIHLASPRAARGFVPITCALVTNHAAREHAFGAGESDYQLASGGTLFFDDALALSEAAQRQLAVRHAQSGEATAPRLVFASTREPEVVKRALIPELASALAYVVRVAPLRERKEDIAPIAARFVEIYSTPHGKTVHLGREAVVALERHVFGENVRELARVLSRAVLVVPNGGTLDARHLILDDPGPASAALHDVVGEFEREYVLRVLLEHGGQRKKTAAALGISRQALLEKLKKYGVSSGDE